MAQTPARRTWLLTALLVAVVVVVAVVAFRAFGGDADDDSPASAPTATSAPSAAAPTTAAPTEVTAESFCAAFVSFANANATYAATLDAETGQALVEVARGLFALPTPDGMSPGARAALDDLVAGALPQVESAGVSIDAAPDPANDAEPDQAAFDQYLETSCPA